MPVHQQIHAYSRNVLVLLHRDRMKTAIVRGSECGVERVSSQRVCVWLTSPLGVRESEDVRGMEYDLGCPRQSLCSTNWWRNSIALAIRSFLLSSILSPKNSLPPARVLWCLDHHFFCSQSIETETARLAYSEH